MTSDSGSDGFWVPKPPDGGWGWVILFACFNVNFVWGGLFNSYGILYKEFLDYFGQSRGYTSLIGSVLNGVGYGAGIVASGLMNRYGIRSVAIVGAAIGGISCALCTFANSVAALIFLFGGGVGISHALSYTAAYVITPYYFEKRRGMATGISIAGSGIGNMVCAPLMRYLLTEYTWRGFLVIQGGLILQCCIFSALFRPVPVVRLDRTTDQGNEDQNDGEYDKHPSEVGEDPRRLVTRHSVCSDPTDYVTKMRHSLLPAIPEANVRKSEGHFLRPPNKDHRLELNRTFSWDGSTLANRSNKRGRRRASKPFIRKDIFYVNSLRQLDEYRSRPDLYWQNALSVPMLSEPPGSTVDQATATENAPFLTNRTFPRVWARINEMLGLDLFRRGEFLCFTLAIFALYLGYYVPYTVIYDFALERGVDEGKAVLLVSVLGLANTIGRVLFGSVADLRGINRVTLFAFVLFSMGTICCFCVFYSNFYVMAAYGALFAAGVGASKALTLIVTVDLLGLENLTHAYGLLLVFQGLGFAFGNPLAGWLHDITDNYVVPFSIIGVVLIVSGALVLMAHWFRKRAKSIRLTEA